MKAHELALQVDGRAGVNPQPAIGRHAPLPGIDSQDDLAWKARACLRQPARILKRSSANDHPLDPPAKNLGNVHLSTQATAQLARDAGRCHDLTDAGPIDRPARARSIEIDEVQIRGALGNPALGHGGRVAAKHSLLRIIPLPQPHALAASDIDGWENEHGRGPYPVVRGP